jgi:hypothetical protein
LQGKGRVSPLVALLAHAQALPPDQSCPPCVEGNLKRIETRVCVSGRKERCWPELRTPRVRRYAGKAGLCVLIESLLCY